MGHCDSATPTVVLQEFNHTPIREDGYRQACDPFEGRGVIERLRQHTARLRQKGQLVRRGAVLTHAAAPYTLAVNGTARSAPTPARLVRCRQRPRLRRLRLYLS